MATPRPKTFVAVRSFTTGRHHVTAGDEVANPALLAHLLRFGDTFVTAKGTKSDVEPAVDEPVLNDTVGAASTD